MMEKRNVATRRRVASDLVDDEAELRKDAALFSPGSEKSASPSRDVGYDEDDEKSDEDENASASLDGRPGV